MAVGCGKCFLHKVPIHPEDAGPCSPPEPSTWVVDAKPDRPERAGGTLSHAAPTQ